MGVQEYWEWSKKWCTTPSQPANWSPSRLTQQRIDRPQPQRYSLVTLVPGLFNESTVRVIHNSYKSRGKRPTLLEFDRCKMQKHYNKSLQQQSAINLRSENLKTSWETELEHVVLLSKLEVILRIQHNPTTAKFSATFKYSMFIFCLTWLLLLLHIRRFKWPKL